MAREGAKVFATDIDRDALSALKGEGADAAILGCGDIAIDPQNPETVYAVLYARQRTPWSFAPIYQAYAA